MINKKIAVTGATGLLGGYIVAELIRKGYRDITLLVRDSSRLQRLYDTLDREGADYTRDMFRVAEVELNNPRELAEVLAGVDTIFHAAAIVSLSGANPAEIIEINTEMTAHVVNAALESGVRLLVHTSSIGALGGMRHGKMYIDEQSELVDMSSTSPYGKSKFFAENEVWRGAALGLKVVVVNPAVILGVGDWSGSSSTQIVKFFAKGSPFYTTGVVAYVDARDVARAEVALSECEEAFGERFVLAAENMSFRQVMSLAAEAAGRRKPFIRAGRLATDTALKFDAAWSRLSGTRPTLTRAAVRSSQEKSYYNGEKIRKYIDFKYTPIKKTITEVVGEYIKWQKSK